MAAGKVDSLKRRPLTRLPPRPAQLLMPANSARPDSQKDTFTAGLTMLSLSSLSVVARRRPPAQVRSQQLARSLLTVAVCLHAAPYTASDSFKLSSSLLE